MTIVWLGVFVLVTESFVCLVMAQFITVTVQITRGCTPDSALRPSFSGEAVPMTSLPSGGTLASPPPWSISILGPMNGTSRGLPSPVYSPSPTIFNTTSIAMSIQSAQSVSSTSEPLVSTLSSINSSSITQSSSPLGSGIMTFTTSTPSNPSTLASTLTTWNQSRSSNAFQNSLASSFSVDTTGPNLPTTALFTSASPTSASNDLSTALTTSIAMISFSTSPYYSSGNPNTTNSTTTMLMPTTIPSPSGNPYDITLTTTTTTLTTTTVGPTPTITLTQLQPFGESSYTPVTSSAATEARQGGAPSSTVDSPPPATYPLELSHPTPLTTVPGSHLPFPISLPFNLSLYAQQNHNILVTTTGLLTIGDMMGYDEADSDNHMAPPFFPVPYWYVYPGTAYIWWTNTFCAGTGNQGIYYQIDNKNELSVEWLLQDSNGLIYHYLASYNASTPGNINFYYFSTGDGGYESSIGVQGLDINSQIRYVAYEAGMPNEVYPGLQLNFDTANSFYSIDKTFDTNCFPPGTFPVGICSGHE